MIYVDESWSLRRKLLSLLYDHSAEQTKWALIYVFAMHVNRSENQFTASRKHVDVQKLSHVFVMYMCVMYMSCNACAKTLLLFCVYEQRLCHVFAVYIFATHVNRSENRNWSIYCVAQMCICTKAESCLCNNYVNVVY